MWRWDFLLEFVGEGIFLEGFGLDLDVDVDGRGGI